MIGRTLVTAATAVALWAAPVAQAATVGNAEYFEGVFCPPGLLFADTDYAVPSAGRLTAFQYGLGADSPGDQVNFKALRPLGGGQFEVIGESGTKTLPAPTTGVADFALVPPIVVQAGDVLGFYAKSQLDGCGGFGPESSTFFAAVLDPPPGSVVPMLPVLLGEELNVAATFVPSGPSCDIKGTSRDDVLTGTSRAEVICGYGGNDTIRGGGGNDVLAGGDGEDTLLGEGGFDKLNGGDGADRLEGGDGADRLEGADGDDRLFGGVGPDSLFGQRGNDTLDGGADKDECSQGAGSGSMVNCP